MVLVELQQIFGGHFFGHQKKRHVSHNFAGGRDLNYVAKELIDTSVHCFDFAPPLTEPHGGGLLAQVGVLASGNFVLIEAVRNLRWGGSERPKIKKARVPQNLA